MNTLLKILTLFTIFLPLRAVAAPAQFVDARDYFGADYAYADAVDSLVKQFNNICPDTFCEGEYDNLASLGLDCSVDKPTGKVGQCVWTFAGSYSDVQGATGRIGVKHAVKICKLPLRGSAQDLLAFVKRAGPAKPDFAEGLQLALPGDGRTLMDVLTSCLN